MIEIQIQIHFFISKAPSSAEHILVHFNFHQFKLMSHVQLYSKIVETLGDHCKVEINLLGLSFYRTIDQKSANVLEKDGADRL